MAKEGFKSDFRRNFLAGFAALFPIVLTLVVILWVYTKVAKHVGERVNRACAIVLARKPVLFEKVFHVDPKDLPEGYDSPKDYAVKHIPRSVGVVFGLFIVAIVIYVIGKVLRGYFGRRVMHAIDRLFERFPIIKSIYPHARQFTNIFFNEEQRYRLGRVVAVPYPRKGVYSLGFMTGNAFKDISRVMNREVVTIFIPTSPTPITGFIIFIPREEVVELDVSVDEAFRFLITGGVVVPGREKESVVLPAGAVEKRVKPTLPDDPRKL